MQPLQVLLDCLTQERNIHINIHDISGILNSPMTHIRINNRRQAKIFCDIAKSTETGYRLCIGCKERSVKKSLQTGKGFCGHCFYGMFGAVYPVVIRDSVVAVVYVGNAVVDEQETEKRMHRMALRAKLDAMQLEKALEHSERIDNSEELLQIAEIVADYMKYLKANMPKVQPQLHWLVSLMKQYAEEYDANITLQELAVTYRKNEKYMGRLFKKEMGIGWHEYCMQIRMTKAEQCLCQSNQKIIDIAMECGFNSISYFNRLFREKYNMSPRDYRKKYGERAGDNGKVNEISHEKNGASD